MHEIAPRHPLSLGTFGLAAGLFVARRLICKAKLSAARLDPGQTKGP